MYVDCGIFQNKTSLRKILRRYESFLKEVDHKKSRNFLVYIFLSLVPRRNPNSRVDDECQETTGSSLAEHDDCYDGPASASRPLG